MHPYSNTKMPSPKMFDSMSKSEFQSYCSENYHPFVIKGFAKQWSIVNAFKNDEKAAVEHLRGICENHKMPLTRIPNEQNGRMYYSPDMRAMNFGSAKLAADECFKRILQDNSDADYAIQSERVSQFFPNLRPSLINPLIDDSVEPLIWVGNRVIVAPHFDEADNIAVVAAGKRRFTLFPPEQIANLYIGPLDHTPAGQPISLVDIKNPDISLHPRYKEAFKHGLSALLEPGDAIYIPAPWWHHVESLSPYNILVNYWWSDRRASTAMPYLMLLHAIQSLSTMDSNKQKAWHAIMQYYLFDDSIDPSAHIPEHARGILGKMSPQLIKELDTYIKQELR